MKGRKDEHRRGQGGQLLGPAVDYSQAASTGPGALYTTFPSMGSGSPSAPVSQSLPLSHPLTEPQSIHHPGYPPSGPGSSSSLPPPIAQQIHPVSPLLYTNAITSHSTSNVIRPSSASVGGTGEPPALVPLEDLQTCFRPWRDPTDEHILRQLSSSATDRLGSRSRHSSLDNDYSNPHHHAPHNSHIQGSVTTNTPRH